MVLGDGNLNVRTRLKDGKYPYVSAELQVKHSLAQKDYCYHKAALVRSMFGGKFALREGVTVVAGKPHKWVSFSKSNSYFRNLRSIMYPEGRKRITQQALDMLSPQGIAIWYMDDGSCRVNVGEKTGLVTSCSTSIATMCSESECEQIVLYFGRTHDIEFRPRVSKQQPEGRRYYVEANTANSQKFARLVAPYVIPSMLYKLAHVANLNTHECSAPLMTCEHCGNPTFKANRLKGMCTACYTKRHRG